MSFLKHFYHFLLAFLSYWYYGRPARHLIVVGVTGTKGKSTTCRFIASTLEAGGYKVGLLSTVEIQIGSERRLNNKKMTMLGRGQIQKMLAQMVEVGCQYAVVETSSEGILQYRHFGLHYDIAVFTNLGTEHSERHGGFENLKFDKGKMFTALSQHHKKIKGKEIKKVLVVNGDDAHSDFFLNFRADKKFVYSLSGVVNPMSNVYFLKANKLTSVAGFPNFNIRYPISNIVSNIKLNLIGDFNIYNALAAIAVAQSQNIPVEKIEAGIENVKLVAGRMEFIEAGQDFKVVVDYAHEPMSLNELFLALRDLVSGEKKIIAVVGSDGGGRDKQKRKTMGEIAGKMCDTVVITDVNCYDEDPIQIAHMLAVGARQAGKVDESNLFVEVNRKKAIALAFSLAHAGDVVAITAKGTEPYIAVAGGQKIPWDDRIVAKELLK